MKDPEGRADFETAITRAGYGVSMAA
jgi:hypothetical protein